MKPRQEAALRMRLDGQSFAEIARTLGCTRQNVSAMLSPSNCIRTMMGRQANGRCAECGSRANQLHHIRTRGIAPEAYNQPANLVLLCKACHRHEHARDWSSPELVALSEQHRELLSAFCDQYPGTDNQRAALLGVSRSYVSHLRVGRRPLTEPVVQRIAALLEKRERVA
jgi:predicted transcriptional regulator